MARNWLHVSSDMLTASCARPIVGTITPTKARQQTTLLIQRAFMAVALPALRRRDLAAKPKPVKRARYARLIDSVANAFNRPSGRDRRCRRGTSFEPIARRALSGGNLALRHLFGDLSPQPYRFQVALYCRQIEPLVRGDEIDRHIAADRIHHAEFEEHVAGGRSLTERRRAALKNFKASHSASPVLRLCSLSAFAFSPALFAGRYRDNRQKI